VALPFPAADAIGKGRHLVKHSMNVRHYVLAVHGDRCRFRGAESHVQHRALFRDIDFLAAEHRVTSFLNASLSGELYEQSNGLVGDAIFGEVQKHVRAFRNKVCTTVRILCEQLP
jgi:hypothetical protein